MKHDNVNTYDPQHWHCSMACVYDGAIFIASCIDCALEGEMLKPNAKERCRLGSLDQNVSV